MRRSPSRASLDGEQQEEYSTMLLWLQDQVEGGTPNLTFVQRCLAWLDQAEFRLAEPLPKAS